MKRLLATKPIGSYQQEASNVGFNRTLGVPSLVALGIGAIIGTGIFVLTGLAAAQHAGPAIVVSFIIAGVGSMFAGLCYSEFAAMIPVSGSAYAYSYATLGEVVGWFVGWNLGLEYLMACATVSVGWSRYAVKLLSHYGINVLPATLTSAPFAAGEAGHFLVRTDALINLPAVVICWLATAICYCGIRETAVVNTVLVAIKVTIIVAVIVFGIAYVSSENWVPFIPANTGRFGEFGWSGILEAAAITFYAYIGFDSVSTVAQEAKNPHRGMPIGILGSLAICSVLYVLMSAVLTGLVPYAQLNDAAPVAVALEAHPQLTWLSVWVIWGALFGLTSATIAMIIPQARIWFAMSHDGLLPPLFGVVHPTFRTPHVSTLITGSLASSFAGLLPIGILGELVSIGTLIAFIVVCGGVLLLRYTRPDLDRPFRVPAPWFTCTAGMLFCGAMAYALPAATWLRLLVWSAIGFAIYFGYGYRNSKLRVATVKLTRIRNG
jgi:APA family basic amino acid/polyamine antiporter